MSLINDALKRAQRDRTGDTQSPQPAPSAGGNPPHGGSRSSVPWLAIGGVGALLGALVAVGVLLLVRSEPTPTPPSPAAKPILSTAAASPTPASQPSETSVPATAQTLSPAELPLITVSTADVGTPPSPSATTAAPATSATAVETLPPTNVEPETPAPTPVAIAIKEPETPPVPNGPARPSARMISVVEALRVVGIRAAGADSKVIMNDRVYRLGDIVDHELGLRLTGVAANALTFVDETGASYTRNFY